MIRLHGYWRSSAAYRVRIALNLKGLAYHQVPHDLRTGAQRHQSYTMLNPQGLVPALETNQGVVTQSLAILEWLEETHPAPALLPASARGRATVRAMAALIACDIHPLNNLRVLTTLRSDLGADEAQVSAWIGRWITEGFGALETLVARHGGRYAFGDTPSLADCCLIPQVYSAERFGVDLSRFPRILDCTAAARALEPVAEAHPDRQPDADPA
ncbi:maleylpyruvate isomerase [Sphingomonas desiccabilis]|nr:maleylpyruvate isomerase [Sphingomonas desiccabilis]